MLTEGKTRNELEADLGARGGGPVKGGCRWRKGRRKKRRTGRNALHGINHGSRDYTASAHQHISYTSPRRRPARVRLDVHSHSTNRFFPHTSANDTSTCSSNDTPPGTLYRDGTSSRVSSSLLQRRFQEIQNRSPERWTWGVKDGYGIKLRLSEWTGNVVNGETRSVEGRGQWA